MIHLAVSHLVSELNAYINLRTGIDDRVVQATIMNQNGQENNDARDQVVLSLVNLEEDRITRSIERYERQANDRLRGIQPEVRLNAYLLFAANLSDYDEALKSLSHVVAFFQNKRYFDYAEIPDLADEDGRLLLELYSLTFEQVNHLWGALGAKYMPSVVYKMRMVTIQDAQPQAEVEPVTEILITD